MSETHVVVLLEILEILIFVLSERLCDIRVLDHIEHGLCLLLEPLVRRHRACPLLVKFCVQFTVVQSAFILVMMITRDRR
jgi:hypothetical protein